MNPAAKRALIRLEQQSGCATRRTAIILDVDSAQIYIGYQCSHVVMRGTDEDQDDFKQRVMRDTDPRTLVMTRLEYDAFTAEIERMI
jgi:hypothetical protein